MGEIEADELIDLELAGDETGKTNDVGSRLIVTNCTKSCSFLTCCLFFVHSIMKILDVAEEGIKKDMKNGGTTNMSISVNGRY
jgi:hypothetical protein